MQETKNEVTAAASSPSQPMSCFSVYVGEHMFGIPVSDTQCIFRVDKITPVPLSPRQIAGLANLRGRALAVVSLKSKFDGSAADIKPGALAIGFQVASDDYALVIDRVGEVLAVEPGQRMSLPSHVSADHARLIEGLYKVGDDLVTVLNVRELFA